MAHTTEINVQLTRNTHILSTITLSMSYLEYLQYTTTLALSCHTYYFLCINICLLK